MYSVSPVCKWLIKALLFTLAMLIVLTTALFVRTLAIKVHVSFVKSIFSLFFWRYFPFIIKIYKYKYVNILLKFTSNFESVERFEQVEEGLSFPPIRLRENSPVVTCGMWAGLSALEWTGRRLSAESEKRTERMRLSACLRYFGNSRAPQIWGGTEWGEWRAWL